VEDSDMHDTDPDDLEDNHGRTREPSELYGGGDGSDQEDAEIDLSENEVTEPKEDEEAAPMAATKYVPPHMRAAQLAEKAQGSKEKALSKQKLERKLQGLLNK
jgi:nucleolar MIF4G domain-containing protein 1